MAYAFEFILNPRRGAVTINMSGFFSDDAVPLIAAGMADAIRKLHCGPNQHLTLIDVTGCQIQSQHIIAAFQKLVTNPMFRSRRLAFVTGSSIIKMQLRRIINDDSYARIFDNHSAAEAWLKSQSEFA